MFKTFLIKYGEIAIKGKNRHLFEDALVRQIRHALKKCDGEFSVYKEQGRIYVDCEGMYDYEETVGHLQHVFGIVGICPVMQVEDHGIEELGDSVIEFLTNVYDIDAQTFKVNTRRANKQYPIESMEVNAILGGRILDAFPNMKVDVHHPEILIHVELRESGKIFIYSGAGRYAGRHEWKGNAAALRRHRQSGGRLYDLQAWCKAGCNLLPCAAIYERACEAEGY